MRGKRKVRISVTLAPDILDRLDALIRSDPLRYRSRSDGIEQILKRQLIEELSVVVLAGGPQESLLLGKSEKFRPLASLSSEITLVENIVNQCRDGGFRNFLVVGTQGEGGTIPPIYDILSNGSKHHISIRYLGEEKPLGTARTLEVAREYLKQDFLIVPCDAFFDFNVKPLMDFHRRMDASCTLAVYHRTDFTTESRGVVEMDGPRIISHEEHPLRPRTHLIGTLIACLSPHIFDHIPHGNTRWSLQQDIFPRLIEEGTLFGYLVPGNWVNVHTEEDLALAQRFFQESTHLE